VSGTPSASLNAAQVRELLTELGARLAAQGTEARLFLVGGAAMALAFSRKRITRDLDAVFEPKREIYAQAAAIAHERGLPEDWLNDSVKGLLPNKVPPVEGTASFSAPGIHVGVASAEYLFAMKAAAARLETDGEDLRTLAQELGITSSTQALDLVERFYHPAQLTAKTQLILESIISDGGADTRRPRRAPRSGPTRSRREPPDDGLTI
jgi:hypothetical protein